MQKYANSSVSSLAKFLKLPQKCPHSSVLGGLSTKKTKSVF